MRIGWRAPKATSWRVDQPAVPRERFEDIADVGIGDPDVLAGLSTREVRATLVLDFGLHTRKIVERFARVNVTHTLEYSQSVPQ